MNEEIESNIQITREIESEIVKCSEIESSLAARESELTKTLYVTQFEINGLATVTGILVTPIIFVRLCIYFFVF